MTPDEQILAYLANLGLKELLTYIVKKGTRFTKELWEKVNQIIRDKHSKEQYAFVPNKQEAEELIRMSETEEYIQVKSLVPNYKHIDLIRTGLLIKKYLNENTPTTEKRIVEIKSDVFGMKDGYRLIKIVRLPGTPFFGIIMRYMFNLKREGHSNPEMEAKFEEVVDMWERSSKFVEWENRPIDVIKFCETHIGLGDGVFFILGMKSASRVVEKAINELEREKFFERNGYNLIVNKITEGAKPRLEVMAVKKDFV